MAEPSWERGSWIQTYSGVAFYPMDPDPEDVRVDDIAHALALTCRYGGHTSRFYSVAEHCVLMAEAVPAEHAMAALLHDAAEAYVGDLVRPLKHHMPAYVEAEDRVAAAIGVALGRPGPVTDLPEVVKEADNRILLDERAELLAVPPQPWVQEGLEPLGVIVAGLSPLLAETLWLSVYEELAAQL